MARCDAQIGCIPLAEFFVVRSPRATIFYFIDGSIPSDFWRSLNSAFVKVVI
jgi:hypothetical protein